ncbi:hypothetical protein [Aeoliella sp. SH292]|uniref:hypothetical protein n=1 Tax=Aeoliella sp. SH292 TaxID=3454464 RepID=UPI003F9B2598
MTNPYQSPQENSKAVVVWYKRWMVITAIACLVLAGVCLLATVVSMHYAFHVISNAAGSPKPEDLASAIAHSLTYSYFAVPFALSGLVLLVLGIRSKG